MKSKLNQQKGITLIALVVTIIILLILAGVAISMALGDNGLFKKAQQSSEINKRASYLEELRMIGSSMQIDKISQDLSGKEYIDKFEEEIAKKIEKGGMLEGSSTIRKDDEQIRVITKEGEVYEVTPNGIEYKGKQGDESNQPPEIKQGDIIFTPNHTTPVSGDVLVEITSNINIEGYYIQYSYDNISWKQYNGLVKLTENGKLYARVANALDESKGTAETEITIIDKVAPEILSLTFSSTNDKITGTAKDTGTGINGYAFSKSEELALDSTEWKEVETKVEEASYSFTAPETGKYYFYVKDQANNITKQSIEVEVVAKVIYVGSGTSVNVTAKCEEYGIDPSTLTVDNFIAQPTASQSGSFGNKQYLGGMGGAYLGLQVNHTPSYNNSIYSPVFKLTPRFKGTPSTKTLPAEVYLVPQGKSNTAGLHDMGATTSVDINDICTEMEIDRSNITENNFLIEIGTYLRDLSCSTDRSATDDFTFSQSLSKNYAKDTGIFTYSAYFEIKMMTSYNNARWNHYGYGTFKVYFIPSGIIR